MDTTKKGMQKTDNCLNPGGSHPMKVTYQIFTLQFIASKITDTKQQQCNFTVEGHHNMRTVVLKGHSIRKVENHCSFLREGNNQTRQNIIKLNRVT